MANPQKKIGRPEETAGKINASILLQNADSDFLDSFDPGTPRRAEPKLLIEKLPAQAVRTTESERQAEAVAPRVQEGSEPRLELPRKGKKPGPEPAPRTSAERRKKVRPPRADIGFRPELEAAAAKLRKEAITQSAEPTINRTDVVSAATCAIARTLGTINYSRIQPRGHYGTPSARQLHEELEEAYVMAIGEHYIERYRHRISDRALRQCYELYKQRMEADDEEQLPRPKS